jgi:hypothetical protein
VQGYEYNNRSTFKDQAVFDRTVAFLGLLFLLLGGGKEDIIQYQSVTR